MRGAKPALLLADFCFRKNRLKPGPLLAERKLDWVHFWLSETGPGPLLAERKLDRAHFWLRKNWLHFSPYYFVLSVFIRTIRKPCSIRVETEPHFRNKHTKAYTGMRIATACVCQCEYTDKGM